jgi:hypothetical protein
VAVVVAALLPLEAMEAHPPVAMVVLAPRRLFLVHP